MIFFAAGSPGLCAIAAIAALYHLLNHSVFKGLLFMGAGSIMFSTHTKNLEELGGLIKKMPVSSILFFIGILSISALPPFSGFVSEWLTFQSLLMSFSLDDTFIRIALSISAAALALTGALAAFCFLKTFGIGFLALPRSYQAEHAKEVNFPMMLGMGFFALLSVLFGVLPMFVIPFLNRITQTFTGANAFISSYNVPGIINIPPGNSMSTPALLLLLLLMVMLPLMILYLYNGKKRSALYETWGCGQPVSTARNEYTGTAFSKPVQMWLSNFYKPTREITATYSASPFLKESVSFDSRIEQIFERYIYTPVVEYVLSRSRRIRVIQTGSIHAYLTYIFGTMVVLFMLMITGGI
jgi:hydrogenase-4 component B